MGAFLCEDEEGRLHNALEGAANTTSSESRDLFPVQLGTTDNVSTNLLRAHRTSLNGQGLIITAGDGITWTGTSLGKFGSGGSVSYRGMIFNRTESQKMARLNNTCGAFEFETDPDGNTGSTVWEWK